MTVDPLEQWINTEPRNGLQQQSPYTTPATDNRTRYIFPFAKKKKR